MEIDFFIKYGAVMASLALIIGGLIGFLFFTTVAGTQINVKEGYAAYSWLLISISMLASSFAERRKFGTAPEPYVHPILKLLFQIGPVVIAIGFLLSLLKMTTLLQSGTWALALSVSSAVDALIPFFFFIMLVSGLNRLARGGFAELGFALRILKGIISFQLPKLTYAASEPIRGKLLLLLNSPQGAKELKVRLVEDQLMETSFYDSKVRMKTTWKRAGKEIIVGETVLGGEGIYTSSAYDFELMFKPSRTGSLVWDLEGVLILKDSSVIKGRLTIKPE